MAEILEIRYYPTSGQVQHSSTLPNQRLREITEKALTEGYALRRRDSREHWIIKLYESKIVKSSVERNLTNWTLRCFIAGLEEI